MRDAATLFEQELARQNRRSTMPSFFGFVGMMEQDPESVYDLLPLIPSDTDSEFDSEGNCHPVRECNMLHLSKNRAIAAGGEEDDTYLIPCTLGEQAEYEQERLERAKAHKAEQANERHDGGCPSPQHLNAEGEQARAQLLYDRIQQGKGEMPVFPRASQNITVSTMIM